MNKKYRLKVDKTSLHVYVTLINNDDNQVIGSSSTLALKYKKATVENCYKVGEAIGKKAMELKCDSISFDRNGFIYHGKIESLAKGAREAGLRF